MIVPAEKNGWCVVHCDGGCDRSVTLRKCKVHEADYYICGCKANGMRCECENVLPEIPDGMVCRWIMNAAASFSGYKYELADEETLASIERAKKTLRLAKCKDVFDRCFVD